MILKFSTRTEAPKPSLSASLEIAPSSASTDLVQRKGATSSKSRISPKAPTPEEAKEKSTSSRRFVRKEGVLVPIKQSSKSQIKTITVTSRDMLPIPGEALDPLYMARHISPYTTYTPNFINEIQDLDLAGGIAVDCETTGLSVYEGDAPFSISFCDRNGKSAYVEWPVNPFTREITAQADQVEIIRSVLENKKIPKMYHHAKFDVRMIEYNLGIHTLGRIEDTLFAARVCNTLEFSYGLKPLASKYAGIADDDIKRLKEPLERSRRRAKKLGYKLGESKEADYWLLRHLLTVDFEESSKLMGPEAYIYAEQYCRLDTFRTMRLWQLYESIMSEDAYYRSTYDREIQLYYVVFQMETRGIRISKEKNDIELQNARDNVHKAKEEMLTMVSEDIIERYDVQLMEAFMAKDDIEKENTEYLSITGQLSPEDQEALDKRKKRSKKTAAIVPLPRDPRLTEDQKAMIRQTIRERFNPGSNKQVVPIIYNFYGLEVKKTTESGLPSTDWDALKDHAGHPFIRAMLAYRGSEKAIGTFFDKYNMMMKPDPLSEGEWCLHPGLNQLGTTTARFSCIRRGTRVRIARDNEQGYLDVPIESVAPGDLAFTYDSDNKLTVKPVQAVWNKGDKRLLRLHWESLESSEIKGHVDMTPDHEVRKDNGKYGPLNKLSPNALLLGGYTAPNRNFLDYERYRSIMTSRETLKGKESFDTVYDLTIADTYNFIANGVAVHNCIRKGTMIEIVRDVSKHPKGIQIEDVKVGDLAYTFDENNKLTLRKVTNTWYNGKREILRLHWRVARTGETGYTDMTPEHLVKSTTMGFVRADSLKKRQCVYAMRRETNDRGYSCIQSTGQCKTGLADHRFIYNDIYGVMSSYANQVHHKDHNKLNNTLENLLMMTPKEHYSEHARHYTDQDRANKSKAAYAAADSRRKQGISNKGREYKPLDKEKLMESLSRNEGNLVLVAKDMGVESRSILRRMKWWGINIDGTLINNHMITGIEKLSIVDDVYDIEIEETHNFIADQICCHNCSSPNLQQVSSANTNQKGTAITARAPFGPRRDHVLLLYDYAQQEARIFAACANIQTMINWVLEGRDLNTENANKAWGGQGNPAGPIAMAQSLELGREKPSTPHVAAAWKELQWTSEDAKGGVRSPQALSAAREWMEKYDYKIVNAEKAIDKKNTRGRAKVVLFAKLYGGGPSSVQGLLYCTEQEAKEYMDTYDKAFPEIKAYMEKMSRKAERDGYIINYYGRKLVVEYDFSYRAVNYMIQSNAADMMKDSIRKVHNLFQKSGKRAYVLMTIHDELMMEVHKDDITPELITAIGDVMADCGGRFSVPMSVEGSIADDSWANKYTIEVSKETGKVMIHHADDTWKPYISGNPIEA